MRINEMFKKVTAGMGYSVGRFPLAVLFLVVVAVLNSIMIESTDSDYSRFIFTFLVGTMLGVVGQMLYERFFEKSNERYLLMGGALLLTMGYYFTIGYESAFDIQIVVKTSVAMFALLITFIWVPTIKNKRVPFHSSFLSAVKAFFTSFIFTLVLALGVGAIIAAVNILLFTVDSEIYFHIMNVIGVLFAPIYFLSLTPFFPVENKEVSDEIVDNAQLHTVEQQFMVPRFLEILISYIIIPLTGIYTVILVLYVFLNISGDFWTDNLLEPLLVSYAIVVIVVYILACNLENRFSLIFRAIFPKILVPIVLFQVIASVLKIGEMGVTHGRYFVILFGVFAIFAGLVFSLGQIKYNGLIAIVLLILTTVSIIPPIDAFTVSRNNQINLLEEKLTENDMLDGDSIVATAEIPREDRVLITKIATYLENMGYTEEVDFFPNDFNVYNDFNRVFGFEMTYPDIDDPGVTDFGEFYYIEEETPFALPIGDYNVMIRQSLYDRTAKEEQEVQTVDFVAEDNAYILERLFGDDKHTWMIKNASENELITFDSEQIYDALKENIGDVISKELTVEEATLNFENDRVNVTVIVNSLERTTDYMTGKFLFFINLK